jgi:hypothetical protein
VEHIRYKTPENYTSKKLHEVTLYRDGTQCRGRGVNVRQSGRSAFARSIERLAAWPPGNRPPPPGNRSRLPPATATGNRSRQPLEMPATGNRSRQPATAAACLVLLTPGKRDPGGFLVSRTHARETLLSSFSRFERQPGLIVSNTLKPLDTIITSDYYNKTALI